MATTDDALETYTHLPINLDPSSKQLSITSSDTSLQEQVAAVNAIHTLMKSLDTSNNAPPAPMPVNPKRSAQIAKLRETATQHIRKGQASDAIRLLTLAIEMASSRPPWEPVGLIREEMALCYMERSYAHLLAQSWAEGLKDAECSTECKKGPQTLPNGQRTPGNPKAWVAGARCLISMGRWADSVQWIDQGLEVEGTEVEEALELKKLRTKAKAQIANS